MPNIKIIANALTHYLERIFNTENDTLTAKVQKLKSLVRRSADSLKSKTAEIASLKAQVELAFAADTVEEPGVGEWFVSEYDKAVLEVGGRIERDKKDVGEVVDMTELVAELRGEVERGEEVRREAERREDALRTKLDESERLTKELKCDLEKSRVENTALNAEVKKVRVELEESRMEVQIMVKNAPVDKKNGSSESIEKLKEEVAALREWAKSSAMAKSEAVARLRELEASMKPKPSLSTGRILTSKSNLKFVIPANTIRLEELPYEGEVTLSEGECFIARWEFDVIGGHDVAFSVLSGNRGAGGLVKNVGTIQGGSGGEVTLAVPGSVCFRFENKFSWIRPRTLHIRSLEVAIVPINL